MGNYRLYLYMRINRNQDSKSLHHVNEIGARNRETRYMHFLLEIILCLQYHSEVSFTKGHFHT
jgi:hypothetical protein